ncbi:MAG: aldehyde ferredoxin oxidoreductase C-terminal domain-containing protein [Dehalococcoidia bacterium]|nr:aldehyde ferredoxin oxidoreductase C-terminal domain-containing protein [Dehalococcoidia bacterium]
MKESGKTGLEGRVLRVDLSTGSISTETIDAATMRLFIGGTGLGAKILYEEVPPGVEWSDPGNRFIVSSGPLGGTKIMGSGTISIVAKGPLTNGATSTQANGFLGAFMRLNGYDSIVFLGAADKLVYLLIADGKAEIRDATHLAGKDTWETQDAIAEELGKREREISVFSVGPAGENLVKFGAVAGDKGHVAGHNGSGAVMGSKKLKAIAIVRGKGRVKVHDDTALTTAANAIIEALKSDPAARNRWDWGTGMGYNGAARGGWLPVKNYTTNSFPDSEPFMARNYRTENKIKLHPCWACQMHHLHMITIAKGPYAGYVGEEPEYEQWAAWGAVIGNTDPAGALVLANDTDRLGLENNEAGWVISWVMECFEKGLFTEEQTDGLKMTWGNVEAARAMLGKIARREGFGNLLAEGVMRASKWIGGEAASFAIYTQKGNSPRGHDHRARWYEMFDTSVSNTGTIENGALTNPREIGATEANPFSGQEISTLVAKAKGRMVFEDCTGVCRFCGATELSLMTDALSKATGWDIDVKEAYEVGRRIVNLLRSFNVRHGITPEVEAPSQRYGSVPTDGPAQGKNIAPEWDGMMDNYYNLMGWDRKTGKPLPETLRRYGLLRQLQDLW